MHAFKHIDNTRTHTHTHTHTDVRMHTHTRTHTPPTRPDRSQVASQDSGGKKLANAKAAKKHDFRHNSNILPPPP